MHGSGTTIGSTAKTTFTEKLELVWPLSQADETLNKIGECIRRMTLKQLKLQSYSLSLQSEEAIKEWIQLSVVVVGNCLIRSLEHSQITDLIIIIKLNISCRINGDDVKTQLDSSLRKM